MTAEDAGRPVDRTGHPDHRMLGIWGVEGALAALFVWWAIVLVLGLTSFAGTPMPADPAEVTGPPGPFDLLAPGSDFWIGAGPVAVLGAVGGYVYWSRYRWKLSDDGVRIHRGVVVRRRVTIPYDRIQNVNVRQGPIAQILGIEHVDIETAGSAAVRASSPWGWGGSPEGRLPGVRDGDAWADVLTDQIGGGPGV